MADTSMGMAPYPGQINSIQSRCICKTCYSEPRINAKGTVADPFIEITANCHGESETRNMTVADLRNGKSIEFFKKDDDV